MVFAANPTRNYARYNFSSVERRLFLFIIFTRSIAVFADMPSFIFFSAILTLRYAFTGALPQENGDVSPFLGSDVSSLPPGDSSSLLDHSSLLSDDSTQLPVNSDDLDLNPLSSVDQSDDIFGDTQPVELAGVHDLCAADENTSMFGRMRTRDEPSSCTLPNANQLKVPDFKTLREKFGRLLKGGGLGDLFGNDNPAPLLPPPPLPPVLPQTGKDGKNCPGDYGNYIYHLCCTKFTSTTESAQYKFYNWMKGCTEGTKIEIITR